MTFKDLLLDKIQQTQIFEFAYNREKIFKTIRGFVFRIHEHIIKIEYFYDSYDYNGHIRSINTWLKDCQKMTLDGKHRLDKKYYFEMLFSEPIDDGDSYIEYYKDLKRDGYKPVKVGGFDEFYEISKKAFLRISEDISKNNFDNIENYFNFKG